MDRIRQLKNLHTRLKKRNFAPKIIKKYVNITLTDEQKKQKRIRDNARVSKMYHRRRSEGKCDSCEVEAVKIVYYHLGKVIKEKLSHYCPVHLERRNFLEKKREAEKMVIGTSNSSPVPTVG